MQPDWSTISAESLDPTHTVTESQKVKGRFQGLNPRTLVLTRPGCHSGVLCWSLLDSDWLKGP